MESEQTLCEEFVDAYISTDVGGFVHVILGSPIYTFTAPQFDP